MGRYNRKSKPPARKLDQLAALKAEEIKIKREQKWLKDKWAQEEAKLYSEEIFQEEAGDWSDDEPDLQVVKRETEELAEKIRKKKDEEAHQARERRKREIAEAKAKQELRVMCKQIVDMIKGREYSETDVIVDAEKMKLVTVEDVDIDISWADRSRACEALWAFQFKGDHYKEVVVECGAVETLTEFLASPPKVSHRDQFSVDAFCYNALVCLRSLAAHEPNAEHMSSTGVVQQMIKMVDYPGNDTKILALETLASLAQHSKSTRQFLAGPKNRFLARLLGDKRAGQQNFHRLIKNGLEPTALAGLHLVESLLSKDEYRLFVVNETFALSVIRSIMDSKNLVAQAMACRMVMRLCQSEQCRKYMQTMGVTDFAAEFFVSAYSSESRAMACAALGSLVTSKDKELANKCLPKIWEILSTPSNISSEEERTLMELPGAMRALRAFCKQSWVQDWVLSRDYLEHLVEHISDDEASKVTRAEAAHVIGSIALQTRHHRTIMNCFLTPIPPLLKLIHNGDQIEQFSAARAVQHLSYDPVYCQKFADFKNVASHFDQKTGRDIVTRWDSLGAVTNLCLPSQASNCKMHGAGILRNFASVDSMRKRIMKHLAKKVANCAGLLLIQLLDSDSLATRAHACAALGNLSSTEEYAGIICMVQAGRAVRGVANVLYAEPQTHQDKVFLGDSRISAITTLGLLACNDECAKEVLDTGALMRVAPYLSSRGSPQLRLVTIKCLHNISSFRPGAKAVVDGIGLLDAILKSSKADDENVQMHTAATIANLSAFPEFIDHLMSPRCCSTIVYLLNKGNVASKREAAMVCKNISKSKEAYYCKPLVEAGVLKALVKCLYIEREVPDGCAELALLALARMSASDVHITSKMVDVKGFDGMLQLLSSGCAEVKVSAAKALLYFAENLEFAKLMVQLGGIGHVHSCMNTRDEAFELGGMLLTMFTENSSQKDSTMSKIDRKLAKRNAELRNEVAASRARRDDPSLREKTPNVIKFLHRPRPTTAPDRKDLQSAGSNYEPLEEYDIDDDDFMNSRSIPALLPPMASPVRAVKGIRRGSIDSVGSVVGARRASINSTTGLPSSRGALRSALRSGEPGSPPFTAFTDDALLGGRATTAASSRRVTFDDNDDSDGSDYHPPPHLPKIRR